jgi:hypothetical protein
MKRIREARPANSMDKLATRTYALVAKERAKTRRCHAVVDVSCPFRRVTGPDKADSNTD